MDGTLFTQNGRAKFQAGVSSQCLWCPAKDGFHHRAWICPHFASFRAHITPAQHEALARLPPCLVDHGWPLVLPEWEVFSGLLLRGAGFARKSPVGPLPVGDVVELFLDGTCAHPREPRLRYAAWVVTTVPGGVGTLDNQVLLGGHVVGLLQTPFRAELTALVAAVQWAIQHKRHVRLWCDCLGVVKGLRKLLQRRPLKPNTAHSDLWFQLQDYIAVYGDLVNVRKVVSHGAQHLASTPLESWAYWHNRLADEAAESINQRRSTEFWIAWNGVRVAQQFHRKLHLDILKTLLATSRKALENKKPSAREATPATVEVDRTLPEAWAIPPALTKRYGMPNLQWVHDWWTAVGTSMLQGSAPMRFISGVQLYMSFGLHTGYDGPWCVKKRWFADLSTVPPAGQVTWGGRTKLFLSMWQTYLKHPGVTVASKLARPASAAISRWTVCYRLRWTQTMIDQTDSVVFHQLGRQALTNSDLSGLGPPRT